MAFAHHLPPWTHRARERQNLPSLIAYQAILHSKQSGYWLDENFLSVRPAAFRYFYPLPLKEIQPYSIKRLVFRKTCRSCLK